jgi:ribosomal protein L7/L12
MSNFHFMQQIYTSNEVAVETAIAQKASIERLQAVIHELHTENERLTQLAQQALDLSTEKELELLARLLKNIQDSGYWFAMVGTTYVPFNLNQNMIMAVKVIRETIGTGIRETKEALDKVK